MSVALALNIVEVRPFHLSAAHLQTGDRKYFIVGTLAHQAECVGLCASGCIDALDI